MAKQATYSANSSWVNVGANLEMESGTASPVLISGFTSPMQTSRIVVEDVDLTMAAVKHQLATTEETCDTAPLQSLATDRHSNMHSPISIPSSTGDAFLNDKTIASDWVWDWASRPEVTPPSEYEKLKMTSLPDVDETACPCASCPKHRADCRSRASPLHFVSRDPLPPSSDAFMLTHACSFLLGTAVGALLSWLLGRWLRPWPLAALSGQADADLQDPQVLIKQLLRVPGDGASPY